MKILALSDTHDKHLHLTDHIHSVLEADPHIQTIVHAGDGTERYDPLFDRQKMRALGRWLGEFDVPWKVFVPGNHDLCVECFPSLRQELPDVHFLIHQSLQVDGINFFGSPYTPSSLTWAYHVDRDKTQPYWEEIPARTDVLITHGPPFGIGDRTNIGATFGQTKCAGDLYLLDRIRKIEPTHHIFGHFHDDTGHFPIKNYGTYTIPELKTQFHNVSVLDTGRNPLNLPRIIQV